MIELLMNNTVVKIILALCTLIGVPAFVFSLYTFYKNKKKKILSVKKASYHIYNKGNKAKDKLQLLFNGEEVEDVSVTQFAIWGSGNEEIRREDLATEGKLCIKSYGSTMFLDAEIIVENENTNKFSIQSITDDIIMLDFEYVDKKEGVVLQIIHTGNYSNITVDCKIKGGKILNKNKQKKRIGFILNPLVFIKPKILFAFYFVVLSILILCFFIIQIIKYNELFMFESIVMNNPNPSIILNTSIILTGVLFIISLILSFIYMKKVFNIDVPTKLRDYVNVKE